MKKFVSLFIVTALAGFASVASADQKVCGAAIVPNAGTGNCTIAGYGSISAIVTVQQSTKWTYSVNLTSTVAGAVGSARLINSNGTFTRDSAQNLCKEARDSSLGSGSRGGSIICITDGPGALHFPAKIRLFLSRP